MCCGPRLQPVRQRPDRLAQRRVARQQPVERAVARAADRYPDQPVRPGGDVVREAGQVVHEHGVRAVGDRPPPQPVRRGLRHHDERSVRGQRDPVGELQPFQQRRRLRAQAAAQQPSGAGMLQQLALPVVDPDPAGRVAEVDRPVRRHRRVVAERQPVDERLHQPGLDRDPQQPAPGVADQQAAVRQPLQPERPAAGVGEHLDPPPVRGQPQQPPVGDPAQHPAGVVEQHVLGPAPDHVEHVQRRHLPLAAGLPGPGRRGGGLPDDGVDRGTRHALHPARSPAVRRGPPAVGRRSPAVRRGSPVVGRRPLDAGRRAVGRGPPAVGRAGPLDAVRRRPTLEGPPDAPLGRLPDRRFRPARRRARTPRDPATGGEARWSGDLGTPGGPRARLPR